MTIRPGGLAVFVPLVSVALASSGSSSTAAAQSPNALRGHCPSGYHVKPRLNLDFPSEGQMRAFVVAPPAEFSRPAPVWVPLTGSVESTNYILRASHRGANAMLAEKGFMVIGPVRACADQDPDLRAGVCIPGV